MVTFDQLLKIAVIDKFVIAGFLAILGFYLNHRLTALKGRIDLANDLTKLKHSKTLDYLERQLSNFYWPIYIRLQFDDSLWRKVGEWRRSNDPTLKKMGRDIEERMLLPNHEEIVRIIQNNIHLMDGNSELFQDMRSYVRHVAAYRAIRSAGCEDDPIVFQEPWPSGFAKRLDKAAYDVQKRYDDLLTSINKFD